MEKHGHKLICPRVLNRPITTILSLVLSILYTVTTAVEEAA